MIFAIIFLLLSGFFEAIMDFLQFYYTGRSHFWNPVLSWNNKWKPGTINKERFPMSSTILVFITDGWHLMKWCRNRCIDLSLFLFLLQEYTITKSLLLVLITRILVGVIFETTLRISRKIN